jgi:hypothetical protein
MIFETMQLLCLVCCSFGQLKGAERYGMVGLHHHKTTTDSHNPTLSPRRMDARGVC